MKIHIEIPDDLISSYIVCFISSYINNEYSWISSVQFPENRINGRVSLYCDVTDADWKLIIETIDDNNITINYDNIKKGIVQLYHDQINVWFDIVKPKNSTNKHTSITASYLIQYACFNELKYSVY